MSMTILDKKVRRRDGIIELRRYGKWYNQDMLDSLAAYKFNMYNNAEGLSENKNYGEYDVHYVRPTFVCNGGNRGYIVAPTAFFNYMLEDVWEMTWEEAYDQFVLYPFNKQTKNNYGDLAYLLQYGYLDYGNNKDYEKYVNKNITHLPFTCDPNLETLTFQLKKGAWLKWDDDVEKKAGEIPIRWDNQICELSDHEIMEHLVVEDLL